MFWLMAEIISVKTMSDVKQIIQTKVTDKTKALVFCDIDMTAVMPKEKAVRYPVIKSNYMSYMWILGRHANQVKTMITMLTPPILVENDGPKILKDFGVKTIFFTACMSGKVGHIASIKEPKYEALKKLGFDFSKTFGEDLSDPVFYKGILFAEDESSKGTVMAQFIAKKNLGDLDTVVMIDDRSGNLKDVEKAMKKAYPNIKLVLIEYTGAHDIGEPITSAEFKAAWNNAAELAIKK